jgi:hypothetical protein
MREITPYKTFEGALRALDNGGRFYNIFTDAEDETIDSAELAKVAGVYASLSKAFLFYGMSTFNLPHNAKRKLDSYLNKHLKAMYRRSRPQVMPPSKIETGGKAGSSNIVTGFPRHLEKREEFYGFIMYPMTVGKTTNMMMIPLYDQFDVYEVFDTRAYKPPRTVIATTRGSRKLGPGETRFGGFLKKLTFKDPTSKKHGLFLETIYYTQLED